MPKSKTSPRKAAPHVYILMTARNSSAYIEQAIDSLIRQDFRNWTLLFWDDGSTDTGPITVARMAAIDSRVNICGRHPQPVGRVASLKALEDHLSVYANKHVDYVGWLDSDDILHPSCLTDCLTEAVANKGEAVYTMCDLIDERGHVVGLSRRTDVPYDAHSLLTNFITFHFRLIPVSTYLGVGGVDPSMEYAEDFDLCLRISEQTRYRFVPSVLYSYRRHPASISATSRDKQLEWCEVAIKRALTRRGIAGDYSIHRDQHGAFSLIPKPRG